MKEKWEERKKSDQSKKNEEDLPLARLDSVSSSKKKKKGKGLLRLIEAYSKHVEGLQMIQ